MYPRQAEHAYLKMYRIEARHAQDGKCKYCRSTLTCDSPETADHVTPKRLGGLTARGNIVAACAPCNLAKGSRPVNNFITDIKHPPENASFKIFRAWMRRRLNLKIERAEKHISNWKVAA